MTLPYIPPLVQRSLTAPALRSLSRFRVQFARGLDAITGQAATLTRAATGTALDSNGATVTVGHSMPRYESRAWLGGAAAVGLRLAADDLTYPLDFLPGSGTLFVEVSEAGTRTTAGAGLVYLGRDDATGARLWITGNGTNYAATLHNGTNSQTVTLATATPTTGQGARLVLQLDDDGTDQRIRLGLAVIGAPGESWTAWSTAIPRAATWGTGAKMRLNRVGSAGTQGSTWIKQVAWDAGLLAIPDAVGRV